jgi:small-conductance mechanosensitive channel
VFVVDLVPQRMVGLVDHLAAQTSLANILTRVQISFTDGIWVRDIVVIDDDWGP